MLPGFRFLFAAIVLSTSVLIFGLGAAALLRAAHEEFASIPSRRAPPEIIFTQQSDTRPMLAILRVEPSAAEEQNAATPASDGAQVAAPPMGQPATVAKAPEPVMPAAEPEKLAALTGIATPVENSPPSEPPKSEAIASETSVQAETPTQADAPSPAVETNVAAIAEITPAAPNQTAVAAPEQASAPVDDSTRIAMTKIATLGGPAVTIETQPPSKLAPAAVKKSAQARRVVKRRRIAQRARVASPAPPQPANPFGSPQTR
jgi:hypothetical protein